MIKKLLAKISKERRMLSARDNYPWFIAGYMAAVSDLTEGDINPFWRKDADRALKRWVDEGASK